MKILVNSDNSIAMSADLARHIMGEATELFERFSPRLTRVEIHLTDIDKAKTGKVDKRCTVEVRPASAKPMVATAEAKAIEPAVKDAMRKMVRALTTHFGKQGHSAPRRATKTVSAPAKTATKVAAKTAAPAKKSTAAKTPAKRLSKKPVFQARRKSWPKS